ncbi:hypothetical protein C8A05DRAFT_48272 [Staphylotrichum tortipilum]|uniref:Uncharacterized protein n=1 Tax=Staphylotrichum tortipilum TaxID=2831512 RepID=A0AAN6MBG3_9PEZI|nr:hypothetical protein C8A05DRAFT_48272 [Staphylotrichum longicolle]
MTCSFGTAFGFHLQNSTQLNTQSGNGCNRWGWYETPTLATLQAGGFSGPLLVGAGGNDISAAIDVGTWTATATLGGDVTVLYQLNFPPYSLADVHVDLVCTPLATCAPGQYTFNSGPLPNLPSYLTPPLALPYPNCSGGSEAALIVHASPVSRLQMDRIVET